MFRYSPRNARHCSCRTRILSTFKSLKSILHSTATRPTRITKIMISFWLLIRLIPAPQKLPQFRRTQDEGIFPISKIIVWYIILASMYRENILRPPHHLLIFPTKCEDGFFCGTARPSLPRRVSCATSHRHTHSSAHVTMATAAAAAAADVTPTVTATPAVKQGLAQVRACACAPLSPGHTSVVGCGGVLCALF